MNRLVRNLSTACLGLCAFGLLGGLPTPTRAAGIGLQNNLNIRVVVQGESLVNSVVRRGQPLVIDPGKVLWDTNLPAGPRVIMIYGGQPARILHREVVPFQNQDMMLYIVPAGPGRVRISDRPAP